MEFIKNDNNKEIKENLKKNIKNRKETDPVKILSHYLEIGGTMLASHCSNCNSPLFRYHGNIFCPVCSEISSHKDELINNFQSTNDESQYQYANSKKYSKFNSKNNLNENIKTNQMNVQQYQMIKSKLLKIIDNNINFILNEKNTVIIQNHLNVINSCITILLNLNRLT